MSATLFATPVHRRAYLRQVLRAIDALPVDDVPQVIHRKGFREYLYAFKGMNRTVVTGVCGLPASPGQPIRAQGSFDLNKLRTKLTGACVYAPTYLRGQAMFGKDIRQDYFNVLYPFITAPPKIVSKETGDEYTEHLSIPFLILHIPGLSGSPGGSQRGDEGTLPASPSSPAVAASPSEADLSSTVSLLQLCALLYRPLQQAFLKRLPLFIHEQALSRGVRLLLQCKSFRSIVQFSKVDNGETHRGFLLLPERIRPALEAVQRLLENHQGKCLESVTPLSLLSPRGGENPSSFQAEIGPHLNCNFDRLLPVAVRERDSPPRFLQLLQVDTNEELAQLADLVAACVCDDSFVCSVQPEASRRRRLVRDLFISASRVDSRNGTVLAVIDVPPVAQAWSCGLNTTECFRTIDAHEDAAGNALTRPPNADSMRTANFIQNPVMHAVAYAAYCPPESPHIWGNPLQVFRSLRHAKLPGSVLRQIDRMDRDHAEIFRDIQRMFEVRFIGALAPALEAGVASQLLVHLMALADLDKAHVSITVTQVVQESVLESAGFQRKAIVCLDNQRTGSLSRAYLLLREPQDPTAVHLGDPFRSSLSLATQKPASSYTYTTQPPAANAASEPLDGAEEGFLDGSNVQNSALNTIAARGPALSAEPTSRIVIRGHH